MNHRSTVKAVSVVLSLVIGTGAFIAGWSLREHFIGPTDAEFDRQYDLGGARMPLWAAVEPCRQSLPAELEQDRVAVLVLSTFDTDGFSDMRQAAIGHLAHPWRQNRAPPLSGRPEPCWPTELTPAVTAAALKANVFTRTFLWEDSIALAEQLGPRDSQIVEAVARSAFYGSVIPSDSHRTDQRPYARLVLAEFGAAAKPWAGSASKELSGVNEMGTGAAQIAVAAGSPGALRKVQTLMEKILSATPKDQRIPRMSRNRLYELAIALGMGGDAARPYSGPLIDLLNRKVESMAPPFGLIGTSPILMCAVAEHIGGPAAAAAKAQRFCSGPKTGIEE